MFPVGGFFKILLKYMQKYTTDVKALNIHFKLLA